MTSSPYKVLVVDDAPAIVRLLTAILARAGYVVYQAEDGLQALSAMEQHAPDFVVTDWEMPLMNGLELCRAIRQPQHNKYTYVIFLTDRSGSDNLVEGLEAGADDFLSKPIKSEVLLARLKAGERVLRLEHKLNLLANLDPLTDLLTKRAFLPQLQKEWRRAKRHSFPLSCVMIDADYFKRINDSYGHPAGDKVLTAIAEVLKEETRASDILCRYGGEEFIAMLPETDEEAATLWAERVRAHIAELEFNFQDRALRVTCSFGVSQRTIDVKDEEALLSLADQALFTAKQTGRDRVVSYSALELVNSGNLLTECQNFRELLQRTTAADVMTTFLAPLKEQESVEQAARHFLRSRLSSAPVVNADGKLAGIVTEKDLLSLMRSSKDWRRPLHEIMKRNVICYELNTPLLQIHEFLCRVAIRQVIIVHQNRPLGMINQMTLVRWFDNWYETQFQATQNPEFELQEYIQSNKNIVVTAEQLHLECKNFFESVQADQTDLVPMLISSASRIQEKLNDLLALSRHANELSAAGKKLERGYQTAAQVLLNNSAAGCEEHSSDIHA